MKVQLVKAPPQDTGMAEHSWYPPLNLIWLANYLLPHGYEVEILDGQLMSLEKILRRISAPVLGVSFDILSVEPFDIITKIGKERGCFTVSGGHLATALGNALLLGNDNLDAVVQYDGEKALLGIADRIRQGMEVDATIPNIIVRHNGEINYGPIIEMDLKELPLPRRNVIGIDIDTYYRNFQATKDCLGLSFKYLRPTNTYSHKGCIYRTNGNGCSFCSRVDRRFRLKTAKQVYEEYRYLAYECSADHFSDFSDSWISPDFLNDLMGLYEKHGQIPCTLRCYGDVRHVTKETASIMRELNVNAVLLGIESGNETIRRLNGKQTTDEQILSAVSLLAENGIMVADSYVLGLIGETHDTLKDTLALARKIRQMCITEISYWNILTPMPGSLVWNRMKNMGLIDTNCGYHWSLRDLEKSAVDHFCMLGSSGYDYLLEVRESQLDESNLASAEFVPRLGKSKL